MEQQSLIISILFATIAAGTPLLITALGELVTEKSGVMNLGAEGIMAVGAVTGFAVAYLTHNPFFGVLAAMVAGMAMSFIFAILTLFFMANQTASGLALSIFGVGLSAFLGKPYEAIAVPAIPPVKIPLLCKIPFLGPLLFSQHALVYFSWILLVGLIWFLYKSRPGLILRAIGESPVSAHDIGYSVLRIRLLATLFGGAMAGIGGAFLSIFYTPVWVDGMVAGRGWISLVLVVFATWRPLNVMVGAYLFGCAMVTQMFVQGSGVHLNIPPQFMSSFPYLATIVVLVLISRNAKSIRLHSPASLGQTFYPEA